MKVLLIDIDDSRSDKLAPVVEWAGLELVNHREADIYAAMEELHPEIILIDTNSSHRDALEHLGQINGQSAKTVITIGKKRSESINRLAAEAGVSVYAVDDVPPALLQALIDVTLCQFYSSDRLKEEVEAVRPVVEDRQNLNKARLFIMKNYGLAQEQAQDLLEKNANRQRRDVAELAKQLLETGSFL